MRILTPDEITQEFNKVVEATLDEQARAGIAGISRAIEALQQADIDVALDLSGWVGGNSLKMNADGVGRSMYGSGILRIGSNLHEVLLSHRQQAPCFILNIAYFDKNHGDIDNRSWSFDLKNNPDALVEFQKHVILLAGRNEAFKQCDEAGVFEQTTKPRRIKSLSLKG